MPAACNPVPACWRCGASLEPVLTPWGRRSACPACGAELHVCRMCRHYDTGKAKQCREPVAEPVLDKTRANFCDWFQPGGGGVAAPRAGAAERTRLEALFGDGEGNASGTTDARQALDDLFKP